MTSATATSRPLPVRPILGTVFRLGAPSVLESLLQSAVFLVDALMLARLANNQIYLAATAVTGVTLWRLSNTAGITQVGAGAYVARRWGETRFAEAGRALGHAISLGGLIGLVVAIAFWPFARGLFQLLQTEDPVLGVATSYFHIVLLSFPFRLAFFNMTGSMRAAGDTRTPMLLTLLMNALNIGMNYVLIFGHFGFPRMKMDGAAWGTTFSVIIGLGIGLILLHRGLTPRRVMEPPEDMPLALTGDQELEGDDLQLIPPAESSEGVLRIEADGFRIWMPNVTPTIMRVSWPAFWEEILVSIGFMVFLGMVASFGVEALAAHTATVRIESLSFTAGFGVAVATATMIGQALGARKIALASRLFSLNVVVTMVIMGVMGILFVVFPGWFLDWFDVQGNVRDIGLMLMFLIGLQQCFIGSAMTLSGGLRGAGDTLPPFLTQIVGTIGMRIGLGYLLGYKLGMGIAGVYWGTVFDWLMRTIVLVYFVWRGKWKHIDV
ncbi:MATE family efflux transporter [bacterium]|nr:MATE family efflux transporter [bacterium]